MFMGLSWWEILLAVLVGLSFGGVVCYALFMPLVEAIDEWAEAYTDLCKTEIECYEKINECYGIIKDELSDIEEINKKFLDVYKNGNKKL